MNIELTDNNIGQHEGCEFDRNHIAPLFTIANESIEELCRNHKSLLVFPNTIEDTKDKIEKECIFKLENTKNINRVRITTGNMMGFIGINDLKIRIKSRFDNGRDDYFLQYMLQRVMSFNLFNLHHHNEKESIFDFLLFMFPALLKLALRQGIYREYQNFRHNNTKIKGTIDVNKHIIKNVPFMGKVAYSTREYVQDNDITQLIRHTIEFINTQTNGKVVLEVDAETKDNVSRIIQVTPSYNKQARQNVIYNNLKAKIHPYYTGYVALQNLCLQILKAERVRYGKEENELSGILFDGAWLWEEYVYTIIKDAHFIHAENKTKKNFIYVFSDNSVKRYPDFYIKNDIVLDAKYKRMKKQNRISAVKREDINQIITYIDIVNAKIGGFIAPFQNKKSTVVSAYLNHNGVPVYIFGLEISKNTNSYEAFCEDMKRQEQVFRERLITAWKGDVAMP